MKILTGLWCRFFNFSNGKLYFMPINVKSLLGRSISAGFRFELKKPSRGGKEYLAVNGKKTTTEKSFNALIFEIMETEMDLAGELKRAGMETIVEYLIENKPKPATIPLLAGKSLILDHRASRNDTQMVYIEAENRISELSAIALAQSISHLPKEDKPVMPTQVVRLEFDPYLDSGRSVYVLDGVEIPRINLYNPPEYRSYLAEAVAELPESFVFVVESIFDHHEPTVEFFYDYVSTMLKSRVLGIFLLVSTMEGTGKSSLARALKKLVGDNNYMNLNHSFWDRQFNSDAKHKQLCYQDETYIPRDKTAYFKSLTTEEKSGFEQKGKDITLSRNTASFIGSSNDYSDCGVVGDARRFIIPNVTNTKLKDRLAEKGIENIDDWMKEVYDRDISDPLVLANMYKFFTEREVKNKVERIHTKSFYDAKKANFRDQLKCCLDLLLNMDEEEIELKTFKSMLKEEMKVSTLKNIESIREPTLARFLRDTEWRQIQPIGEIYRTQETSVNGDVTIKAYVKSFIGKNVTFAKCDFDRDGIWAEDLIETVDEVVDELDFL